MALITEVGLGLLNAESYCSVAAADAYHASVGNTAWDALDDAEGKEPALRKATQYLDDTYGAVWLGDRFSLAQALDWPRAFVPTPPVASLWNRGRYPSFLAPAPLPAVLIRATAELALKSASGTAFSPDLGPAVKQKTVGPITVVYQDRATNAVRFTAVDNMLSRLLKSSSTIRVVRS